MVQVRRGERLGVPAVEVTGLVKRYGPLEAVRGVDFTVEDGEVFALLGPNGAGKTTILEILEGYRTPTSGTATVLGLDPGQESRALRERIGIVLQGEVIEPYLTAARSSPGTRATTRTRDVDEVLDLVGLDDKADAG